MPIGGPPQGPFLNAAVLVEYAEIRALFGALLAIELELGRVRTVTWGPRTIDLDLLWAESESIASADLVVPHPRLHERAFAILPLLDVAPHAPYAGPAASAVTAAGVTVTDLRL